MKENSDLIVSNVNNLFELPPAKWENNEFTFQLATLIEQLLQNDFPRLINILYRLDVDEQQLKNELKNNLQTNASQVIAKLIVERQIQKLATRKNLDKREDIPDHEKW
jgi:hypothetical protein